MLELFISTIFHFFFLSIFFFLPLDYKTRGIPETSHKTRGVPTPSYLRTWKHRVSFENALIKKGKEVNGGRV